MGGLTQEAAPQTAGRFAGSVSRFCVWRWLAPLDPSTHSAQYYGEHAPDMNGILSSDSVCRVRAPSIGSQLPGRLQIFCGCRYQEDLPTLRRLGCFASVPWKPHSQPAPGRLAHVPGLGNCSRSQRRRLADAEHSLPTGDDARTTTTPTPPRSHAGLPLRIAGPKKPRFADLHR